MIKRLTWQGRRADDATWFAATVPGNIQRDYAAFCGWDNWNVGTNFKKYAEIEDCKWEYRAQFSHARAAGESCFFVTGGIDYACELYLNGCRLLSHEGMFSSFECDLTPHVTEGENTLLVRILPRVEGIDRITLTLQGKKHGSSSYTLHYRVREEKKPSSKILNL